LRAPFARACIPTRKTDLSATTYHDKAAVLQAQCIRDGLTRRVIWRAPTYVYLDNNTPGTNTISGFSRSADGALTALPGSPLPAGGAGLGAGLASQGSIQATEDGRYLLAVDAGSNQISVLRIGWDGTLTPTPGSVGLSPTASRSTTAWCTYPTPAQAEATTPASR